MPQDRMTTIEFKAQGLQLRGRTSARTDYKADLQRDLEQIGLSSFTVEYLFHATRKWRFDFAFVAEKVAVEYDGGIFDNGPSGHTSVSGIMRDIEKINEAQLAGWLVIRVTPQSVANGTALRYAKRALKSRERATMPCEAQKVSDVRRTLTGLLNRLNAE